MTRSSFTLREEVHSDHVIFYAIGYINDFAAETINERCSFYVEEGIKNFIVNFKEVEFINSIGISILISIIEKILQIKGTLYFSNLNRVNKEVFNILEISKFAIIVGNDKEAQEQIQQRKAVLEKGIKTDGS